MVNIKVNFDNIYRDYYPAVVRYAIAKGYAAPIAEEIASEVLTRLWLRRAECKFENEAALRVWIYKAAGLVMLEQRRKTTDDADLSACENYVSDADRIGEQVENMQYDHYIAEIEQGLSEGDRALFRMIFIEKKSYAQCAEENHVRPVTMRANISRLRKKLKPFIAEILEKAK